MSDLESLSRQTLMGINPNIAMKKFQTFDEQIAGRFIHERMLSKLMTLFGGLALLLAAIGLYGVTAYTVIRRTSEIGIRMALGAKRGSVIAMVMRGALVQVSRIGVWYSVGAALCAVYEVPLYDFTKMDARVLAGAIATLTMSACIAGMIPARRAASVDPSLALRGD